MKHTTNTSSATDRLRALAEGPALDLPPVRWVAPTAFVPLSERVRWGEQPWDEPDDTSRVHLCAYPICGVEGPFIEVGEERYTPTEARVLLDRLASAIAMAEALAR